MTGRVIEPLLDAAGVDAGQTVLDLATGPGHVAAGAASRGAVVTGVDVALAMVVLPMSVKIASAQKPSA